MLKTLIKLAYFLEFIVREKYADIWSLLFGSDFWVKVKDFVDLRTRATFGEYCLVSALQEVIHFLVQFKYSVMSSYLHFFIYLFLLFSLPEVNISQRRFSYELGSFFPSFLCLLEC